MPRFYNTASRITTILPSQWRHSRGFTDQAEEEGKDGEDGEDGENSTDGEESEEVVVKTTKPAKTLDLDALDSEEYDLDDEDFLASDIEEDAEEEPEDPVFAALLKEHLAKEETRAGDKEEDDESEFTFIHPNDHWDSSDGPQRPIGQLVGGVQVKEEYTMTEKDIREEYVRGTSTGGGSGGLNNKGADRSLLCVDLTHIPTGTNVRCRKSKDLEENRKQARLMLRDRLQELFLAPDEVSAKKAGKIRKSKNRKRSRSKKKYAKLAADREAAAAADTPSS